MTTAALLLLLLGPSPCESAGGVLPSQLLLLVNNARLEAGRAPVAPEPRLCELAAWRAEGVAVAGRPQTELRDLNDARTRLYRSGYQSHAWVEGSIFASTPAGLHRRWRDLRPAFWQRLAEDDFEHFGVSVVQQEDGLAVALMAALSKRTHEWQQAAPLANLPVVRQQVLDATNAARVEAGRRPLVASAELDRVAQAHAEDMLRRAFYNHLNPEGLSPLGRVRAAGVQVRGQVSENIAKGPFDPAEVVERWMASSGHRRNILRGSAGKLGVGVAFGENDRGFEILWVQVFAGR